MSCREIDKRYETSGYIIKRVPLFLPSSPINFPTFFDESSLQEVKDILQKSELSKEIKNAIWQQYHELFVYHCSDSIERNVLAPQVKVSYNLFNLPDIYYPVFKPLIEENKLNTLNEQDLYTYLGSRLQFFGINFYEYKKFTKQVTNLCDTFDLNEEDILGNPSNIGYNSVLGLRIIDYGLDVNYNINSL